MSVEELVNALPEDDRTDADDYPAGSWTCPICHAENSDLDADCQYCSGEEIEEEPEDEEETIA